MEHIQIDFHRARDLSPFVDKAKPMLDLGESMEAGWRYFRGRGRTITKSIRVAAALTGMSRGDAKYAVCWSETWGDWRPAILQL